MNTIRGIIAVMMLPTCFLTEYFLVLLWFGFIHVSIWWIIYFILADTGNACMVHRLVKENKK